MNLEETDFDYFLSLVDTANPKISMFDWLQYKFENGKLSLPDGELDDQKIELQALVFSSDIIEWWEKVFHKDWTLLRFNNQFGRFRTEIMAIQQTASVSTPSELNSSQRPSGHTVAKILPKTYNGPDDAGSGFLDERSDSPTSPFGHSPPTAHYDEESIASAISPKSLSDQGSYHSTVPPQSDQGSFQSKIPPTSPNNFPSTSPPTTSRARPHTSIVNVTPYDDYDFEPILNFSPMASPASSISHGSLHEVAPPPDGFGEPSPTPTLLLYATPEPYPTTLEAALARFASDLSSVVEVDAEHDKIESEAPISAPSASKDEVLAISTPSAEPKRVESRLQSNVALISGEYAQWREEVSKFSALLVPKNKNKYRLNNLFDILSADAVFLDDPYFYNQSDVVKIKKFMSERSDLLRDLLDYEECREWCERMVIVAEQVVKTFSELGRPTAMMQLIGFFKDLDKSDVTEMQIVSLLNKLLSNLEVRLVADETQNIRIFENFKIVLSVLSDASSIMTTSSIAIGVDQSVNVVPQVAYSVRDHHIGLLWCCYKTGELDMVNDFLRFKTHLKAGLHRLYSRRVDKPFLFGLYVNRLLNVGKLYLFDYISVLPEDYRMTQICEIPIFVTFAEVPPIFHCIGPLFNLIDRVGDLCKRIAEVLDARELEGESEARREVKKVRIGTVAGVKSKSS